MNEKFIPVLGDIANIAKNEKENRFRLRYFIDLALKNKDYDIFIQQLGQVTIVDIISIEGLVEFEKFIPDKIDRHDHGGGFPMGNIIPGSLALNESTKECIERRKEAIKVLGINYISQYIPLMIKSVDDWCKTVKRNEAMDLSLEVSKVVFRIISKILFGTDVDELLLIPYSSPKTGKTTLMNLEEFYFQYTKDEFDGYLDPKGCFFPFLVQYNLVEPYKSNKINNRSFFNAIKDFISKTKDSESVFKKLESLEKFSKEILISDTVMLLFAGFDTISHLLSSCLYFLKKNPHALKKLNESFDLCGISKIDRSNTNNLKDIYENCDYLNYVIKETFRIDGPVVTSLFYYVKEDIKICNVPVSKGLIINPNILYTHYNPKEWHDPKKFIPERFDPESKYKQKN